MLLEQFVVDVPYLKPQPVPPSTIAASSIAPAMEPMMMFVPLGPGDRQVKAYLSRGLQLYSCFMFLFLTEISFIL